MCPILGTDAGRSAPVLISENETIRWDGEDSLGVLRHRSSFIVVTCRRIGDRGQALFPSDQTLSPWQRSRRGGTNRVPTTGARLQRIADDGRGGTMVEGGRWQRWGIRRRPVSPLPPTSPPPPPDSNDGDDPWAPGWTKGRTIPIVVGRREFASVDPNVASPLTPPSLNDHDDDDAVPVGMEQERPTGTASRRPTTARVPLPPRTAGERP